MQRRIFTSTCLILLILSFLLLPAALPADAQTPSIGIKQQTLSDFPTVDPNYIYDQLYYMATHFLHRESGYDDNLPAMVNGHDEFAAYWAQEAMKDLQGFGPQERIDPFTVQGWIGRPAPVPAFNVEVTVPGVVHPEQVVVIGCHYDGEAVSTQSANDDASGCAIELGVAKALGEYWRSHHVYPARTLRFVIFDAEEQGLFGSFHYVNSTVNGDTRNIVAMFNEEQSGIAYPLRYLGETSNPILPMYVDVTPLTNNELYPQQDQLSAQQKSAISNFRSLMQQAVPAAFAQFQALGYQTLDYRNSDNQTVAQPVFTPDQTKYIQVENDSLGSSDQVPFTLAGAPCATLVGNSTYYDNNPPPWSYPFDQKQDTIQLMNTFASGYITKATALTLSLGLPGMLTTWMLHQPSILGEAAFDGKPLAAISDIGQTAINQPVALDAKASFDPSHPNSALSYAWNFGDGATATGIAVSHTYTSTGTYTLTLTVTSPSGARRVSKIITVSTKPANYPNPYTHYQANGFPPSNPQVILPTPILTQVAHHTIVPLAAATIPIWLPWALGGIALIIVLCIIGIIRRRGQREKKEATL
jgi:hypothetical protein